MANGSTTYHVENPRFVPTTGKIAEKNPERIGTVYGTFFHVDEKGQPTGEALTITQKVLDRETMLNPVFDIDLDNGVLTLPSGERGRKASVGIDQDAVMDLLANIRGESTSVSESAPESK